MIIIVVPYDLFRTLDGRKYNNAACRYETEEHSERKRNHNQTAADPNQVLGEDSPGCARAAGLTQPLVIGEQQGSVRCGLDQLLFPAQSPGTPFYDDCGLVLLYSILRTTSAVLVLLLLLRIIIAIPHATVGWSDVFSFELSVGDGFPDH